MANIHPTRIFKKPEELLKAYEEYKESLEQEKLKWPIVKYVGKDGIKEIDYPKLPLTLDGFYVFCFKKYGNIEQYFRNKDGYYGEFVGITTHIRKEIRQDQITGGLLGNYNSNLTARLNGLSDKSENSSMTVNVSYSDLSKKEKEDLRKDFEDEL